MIFEPTRLADAYLIHLDRRRDERGFFARVWCQKEFQARGLVARVAQANLSYNTKRGTLRGLHYQAAPYEETKLVRCVRGAIHDVIVDLREDSPTRGQWLGVTLSAEERNMLYVPGGFAHGFQTLEDDAEVLYQVSQFYMPEAERGIHYGDQAFDITWPLPVSAISAKDDAWPAYRWESEGASGAASRN